MLTDKAPIQWKSTKQKCKVLTSKESEFVLLTEATKELIWITQVIEECLKKQLIPNPFQGTILWCDNMGAIDFSNSPIQNNRSKHINVKLHFVRDLISDSLFHLKNINTNLNTADSLMMD